ncbi:hypothetical protein RJ641_017007 [Dillenia turbinata]|uniref:Uncharacterized protein n=1 Tax=Dillenia turbinata TaxID=194707 RepID=A0AAN8Z050_9MAGN
MEINDLVSEIIVLLGTVSLPHISKSHVTPTNYMQSKRPLHKGYKNGVFYILKDSLTYAEQATPAQGS